MTSGLQVVNARIDYDNVDLLRNVDIAVPPGRIVALLGPSGSGKSSLLRCIAGVQQLASGNIYWDDINVTALPAHKRRFGLVFQDALLFPHMNVARNISFGLRFTQATAAEKQQRVNELLELVGLQEFRDRRPDALSGGEAQRVALARALAPKPRLLCLDEPFGALDKDLRDRLVRDVRELLTHLGTPALHVTHDPDEARRLADDLLSINNQQIESA